MNEFEFLPGISFRQAVEAMGKYYDRTMPPFDVEAGWDRLRRAREERERHRRGLSRWVHWRLLARVWRARLSRMISEERT